MPVTDSRSAGKRFPHANVFAERRSAGTHRRPDDSETLHSRDQGRSGQTELCRSPATSAGNPVPFIKGSRDMETLSIRQSSNRKWRVRRRIVFPNPSRPNHRRECLMTRGRARTYNDPALDNILQLPNIFRPGMVLECAHHLCRDCVNRFALLPGELLGEMLNK
jgi:hypothetical protein